MVIAYHGSGTQIHQFDYAYTNLGRDQLGSGFYFTTSIDEARHYTSAETEKKPKLGGCDAPFVHKVELQISNPLKHDLALSLNRRQVKSILKSSPVFKESLAHFGDVSYDGETTVLNFAINSYSRPKGSPLLPILFCLANDFFPDHIREFNNTIRQVTGFDGVMQTFDGKVHYVAWFPEQIRILEAIPMADNTTRKTPRPR